MDTDRPLTPAEFSERLKSNQLAICLVGMSNAGKSYWSQALVRAGFEYFCCDDYIEEQLGEELVRQGYSGGIADMAKWLGQPYDPQFAANQKVYLDLEAESLQTIIDRLETGSSSGNVVIDTTGSVVHTDPGFHKRLRELSTVVYLEATATMRDEMFRLYISNPKPVVWGDIFAPIVGEDNHTTLARCYPELLAYRSDLYAKMAQVTIPRDVALAIPDAAAFLDYVQNALPEARSR